MLAENLSINCTLRNGNATLEIVFSSCLSINCTLRNGNAVQRAVMETGTKY